MALPVCHPQWLPMPFSRSEAEAEPTPGIPRARARVPQDGCLHLQRWPPKGPDHTPYSSSQLFPSPRRGSQRAMAQKVLHTQARVGTLKRGAQGDPVIVGDAEAP